jgi:hypothetical protein
MGVRQRTPVLRKTARAVAPVGWDSFKIHRVTRIMAVRRGRFGRLRAHVLFVAPEVAPRKQTGFLLSWNGL